MKKRIITGAILFAILALSLVLRQLVSPYFFDVLILLLSTYAAYEISLCVYTKEQNTNKLFLYAPSLFSVLNFAMFIPLVATGNIAFFMVGEICLLAVFIVAVYFLSVKVNENPRLRVFSLLYPTVLFSFFYLANHISNFAIDVSSSLGLFLIVLTFVISIFTDTFAMFGGMLMKGPKLCPTISPKKTISGAISGAVFGMGSAVATFAVFNVIPMFSNIFSAYGIKFWFFFPIGLILSILSQLGDIYESAFKRKLGIKDTGKILPGHGGVMDRLDGVCFNVAGVFLAFLILFC